MRASCGKEISAKAEASDSSITSSPRKRGRHYMNLKPISVRARKPAHGEFDAIAGEFAPGFDLGHVGRLGKAAEHLARLFTRLLARQRESLAAEGVARAGLQRFCRAAGDVGRTAAGTHDSLTLQCRVKEPARGVALISAHSSWPPRHPRSPPRPARPGEIPRRSTPPPPPRAQRRGEDPSAR